MGRDLRAGVSFISVPRTMPVAGWFKTVMALIVTFTS